MTVHSPGLAQRQQLIAIYRVLRPVRTEYSSRNGAPAAASVLARAIAISGTMPDPPAMSCTGSAPPGSPHEVAAERTLHLELVARQHVAHEVGRHLALGDLIDGELDRLARCRTSPREYERTAW